MCYIFQKTVLKYFQLHKQEYESCYLCTFLFLNHTRKYKTAFPLKAYRYYSTREANYEEYIPDTRPLPEDHGSFLCTQDLFPRHGPSLFRHSLHAEHFSEYCFY